MKSLFSTLFIVTICYISSFGQFYVSPSSINFSANNPASQYIYNSASGVWSLNSALPNWLSYSNFSNYSLSLTASNNTGAFRSANLSFYNSTYNSYSTVYVSQNSASTFDVSPSYINLAYNQTSASTVYVSGTGAWSIYSALPSWLTANKTSGNNAGSFTLAATSNAGNPSRSAYLELYNSSQNSYKSVSVYQESSPFYVSPSSITFSANSPASNSVYLGGSGAWSISSVLPSWLQANPTSGTWNGNVTLTAATNNGAQRVTNVSFYNSAYNITTTLAVSQNDARVFDVSPSNINFAANSPASKSIYVSGTGSWSIYYSLPSWLSASQSSGTGPKTITLTATNNPDQYSRSSYVYFYNSNQNSYIYTYVSQDGSNFYVSPSSISFSATNPVSSGVYVGGSGSWSISSALPSWLSVNKTSGYAYDYVSFTAANNTGNQRTANVSFYNSYSNLTTTLAVSQNSINVFDVTPSNINFNANSPASKSIYVSGTGSWSIYYSLPSWLSASQSSGTGPKTITLTATNNPDQYSRSSYVYFYNSNQNSYIYTYVSQDGSNFYVSPSSINFSANSPSSSYVYVSGSGSWSISSSLPSWLTTNKTFGYGFDYLYFYANANNGPSRSANVSIYNSSNGNTSTVYISQNSGQTFTVTPSNINFGSNGNSPTSLFISGSGAWSLTSSLPSWLTLSSKNGNNNSTITLDATKNNNVPRTASLSFYNSLQDSYQNVYVTQAGSDFYISPSSINFIAKPTSPTTVSLNCSGGWNVSSTVPSWIILSSTSGNSCGSFNIGATTNSGVVRSATITLQNLSSNSFANLFVSQNNGNTNPNFGVSTSYIANQPISNNPLQTGTFTITSNNQWNITNVPSWLALNISSGSGNSIVSYTITSSNFTDVATIQINSSNNSVPITFRVEQAVYLTEIPKIEISAFRIFPNPTESDIHIEGLEKAESIYILNVYGEKIYEKTEPSEIEDITTLNISSGVYHVFVTKNGVIEKQKVVVLK